MYTRAFRTGVGWAVAVVVLLLGTYLSGTQAQTRQSLAAGDLGAPLEQSDQRLYGVLGPLGAWPSLEIMLNNNSATEMPITPVGYLNGREVIGQPISLQPAETRWVPVRDLFPDHPRERSQLDGLELRYFGYLLDLRTQMVARRSLDTGSVDVLLTGAGEFRSRVLNAVWVVPSGGRAVITVANRSPETIVVTVRGRGRTDDVRIRPYSSATLFRPGTAGEVAADAVSVTSEAPIGVMRVGGYLEAGPRTFGLIRAFDPGMAKQAHLSASNVRIGRADVQLAVYNPTDTPVLARAEARPATRDGGSPIALPAVVVPPHQAVRIDTEPLQGRSLERASIRINSSGPIGSLIGYAAAIDRATLLAYELPLREGGPVRVSTGNYPWRLDGDYSSIASIVNVGTVPATFSAVITHEGGVYQMRPETLAPGATATFDIGELRARQLVGINGSVLPQAALKGQFKWSITGPVGDARLNGRMEIVSRQRGHSSSYSCGQCCPDSYSYGFLQPVPVATSTGWTTGFAVMNQLRTCSGSTGTQTYAYANSWWVGNSSVTAVNTTGLGTAGADGISEGSSAVSGSWTGYEYVPYYEDCQERPVDGGGNGQVDVQCAVPTNFQQVGSGNDLGNGTLAFTYTWGSSTGNVEALSGCDVGELVTYSPSDAPFPPPFPYVNVNNPTVDFVNGSAGILIDRHTTPGAFRPPYSSRSIIATQLYRYRCSCANGGNWVTVAGPHSITRRVAQVTGGRWAFTITKSGSSATINPLP